MQRIVLGGILLLLLIAGSAVWGITEEEMCVPMGEITLEAPEDVDAKRSPVAFPHAVHFEFSCRECHHMWELESPVVGCSTSGCHELTDAVEKPGKGKVDPDEAILYYKKAYHQKCIGCHKKLKKQRLKMELSNKKIDGDLIAAGPTGCIKCHPKD